MSSDMQMLPELNTLIKKQKVLKVEEAFGSLIHTKALIMKNNRLTFFLVLAITILPFWCSDPGPALASEYFCIEQAFTVEEVIRCGKRLVPQLESAIKREYKRLVKQHENNPEMLSMLKTLKKSWKETQHLQCRIEELNADGGKAALHHRTVEAEKAFLLCLLRMLSDQEQALATLKPRPEKPSKKSGDRETSPPDLSDVIDGP